MSSDLWSWKYSECLAFLLDEWWIVLALQHRLKTDCVPSCGGTWSDTINRYMVQPLCNMVPCNCIFVRTCLKISLPGASVWWISVSSLCCCFQPQTIASGEVNVQTHLSPATSLPQTQFTYQAEQMRQCLSFTLFLSLLDHHAICEMCHCSGSGML